MTTRGVLKPLLEQAILYGADSLLVECKDGFEEVFASRGEVGLGIASVRSSSHEAARLQAVLLRVVRRKRYALIADARYELRCIVYDSFGDDAYELEIRHV
jgi:hypothetical protein